MPFLYNAQQSREVDQQAISQMPVAGFELMQRAAWFAWQSLVQACPDMRRVNVWCGKGNNAGDAYLVAAHAHQFGLQVCALAVDPIDALRGDAELAVQAAQAAGVTIQAWTSTEPVPAADVQVDGLLGTGVQGAPRAHTAAAIEALNAQAGFVLSIDLPSGVNGSTGDVAGVAVHADLVTTFITRKVGSFTGPGLDYAARLAYDDLAVDKTCFHPGQAQLVSFQQLRATVPQLGINTYKHRQGHILVCGGDQAMPGAVILASRAAMRSGAGMVTCVTQPAHRAAVVASTPEVMVAAPEEAPYERADLYVLGPGLGRSDWSLTLYEAVEAASARRNVPVVLDADGLYWLAQRKTWQGGPLTITPHVAEAARLLSAAGADDIAVDVQADRLAAAEQLRQAYQCDGVLKGAGSIIFAHPATVHPLAVCADGNPGMATAGMGDVLSGVMGALLGQLSGAPDAAERFERLMLAVCLHSAAADAAVQHTGELSLLASDVVDQVPGLLRSESP